MKYLAVLFALCMTVAPVSGAAAVSAPQAAAAVIQPGETIEVQVAGEPTLSKSYTVDTNGAITLDMIGQVPVAGRTPEQAADDLRKRLGRYLKQPVITVTASTSTRGEVLVTGEVVRPGPVKLRAGDGLLDALGAAGGLGPQADAAGVTLVRRGQPQPMPLHVDLLLKGDLRHNLPLNDGDILQVPRREMGSYEVYGEVRQPGPRSLDRPTTILEALIASGGLTERADRSRVTLKRKDQLDPIVVDLEQVVAGEPTANLTLRPGDVLTVASRLVIGVAGEVRSPGERYLRNGGTLMEAIMLAGGFTPDANRAEIQVTHRDGTVETASLEGVTTVIGGPGLRSGDLVLVKQARPKIVTVTGAVRTGGPMRYQEGMKITDLLMAVGLQENAKWNEIRVLRGGEGAERQILKFDLEAYLKAPQAANLVLEPGDQIYVEARRRSNGKSLLRRFYEVMPLASLFFGLGR